MVLQTKRISNQNMHALFPTPIFDLDDKWRALRIPDANCASLLRG